MSGSTLSFTPQQQAAIDTRNGTLLVSAAAGSGKTKVLVERLLGYVTDSDTPCDITDFLVITYTRAAAAELKSRILDEISERMAQEPDNKHLRRQSALCYTAHIETIHSFCTALLRENAHLLDISPDFRVADESESSLLKTKVLEELLDSRYDLLDSKPGFSLLVDTMAAGRDDRRLAEIILDAHAKLKSHTDPAAWVKKQFDMLGIPDTHDAAETIWGQFLLTDARRKASYWLGVMQSMQSEMYDHPDFLKAYGDSVAATISCLDSFITAAAKSWDEARALSDIAFPRAKSVKGFDELKETRTKCRDALKKVTAVFECSSHDLLEDMAAVAPAVKELLDLVLDFDEAYSLAKKKRRVIDFSDQEHLALELLVEKETHQPTELAGAVSGRYREILIDEYQDCSSVQELIFNACSRNGRNIFMVGDVKQSIYRFRLADPTIFLGKYKSYKDLTESDECDNRRILLSTNFRSQVGVLDAVNFVFRNIMSEAFGEMDYTEREYLYPGRPIETTASPAVELDVLDMSTLNDEEDEDNPEKIEAEADYVARRISGMIAEGYMIPDGSGGMRPVKSGDFAILLRSVKDKARKYAEALANRNISVSMESGAGFFENLEVSVAISLLDIVDNPVQDIPLIAVLKSPLYGFTPDELAEIRVVDKRGDFYSALVSAAETNDKCRRFLEELNGFRAVAPDMPADRLIWHIYNKTEIFGVMDALNGGSKRRDNLMLLLNIASKYEANGYRGLFGFISFIRRLVENGDEIAEAAETLSDDAVKIMSIHKSKGLEFPVVILADLAKRFNAKDTVKPVLLHAELGVGLKRTDLDRRIEYPTLARMAIARKLTQEMLSEELRVLYVGMTRAREKLIMVVTFADAAKELEKLSKVAAAPVPPQILEGLNCPAGMLLATVLTRPEAEQLRQGEVSLSLTDDTPWEIRTVAVEPIRTALGFIEEEINAQAEVEPALVEALRNNLSFRYPFAKAEQLSSKLTATELKGRYTDFEAMEDAETPEEIKKRPLPVLRPDFVTEKSPLTATERGTALHLAMQYIDFNQCVSLEGVIKELDVLREKRFLTKQQFEAVNPVKIEHFFASTTGKRLMKADKLYREFKFSLLTKALDIFDFENDSYTQGGEDEILFQGVIDCAFVEDGALHIIDFKTDAVTPDTLEEKKKLYAAQISSYGQAMTRLTGLPIGSLILYFFSIDNAAEIVPVKMMQPGKI